MHTDVQLDIFRPPTIYAVHEPFHPYITCVHDVDLHASELLVAGPEIGPRRESLSVMGELDARGCGVRRRSAFPPSR